MKGNLILTVGISGSGKSTWAHGRWSNNPNKYVIVNRDKIREMLFGFTEASMDGFYSRSDTAGLEKDVTRYEDTLIHDGLNLGKTVIVDSTHLSTPLLESFRYWNVPTEILVFEVEFEEALRRDSLRNRVVGENVIRRQYSRFVNLINDLSKNPIDLKPVELVQNEDNIRCFIYDIDGTLAHMDRKLRSPYDWNKVGLDTKDLPTSIVAHGLGNYKTIICTGRDASSLDETEKWLFENGIAYDEIYIRPRGDQRPDWVIKEEMWRKIAEDNYIVGMFDDRLQVVRRARALGLKVFNVEYGNF